MPDDFQLFETLLWDRDYVLLPMHMDRIESSARFFGFEFDRATSIANFEEQSRSFAIGTSYRVKMVLDFHGVMTFSSAVWVEDTSSPSACIAPERVSSIDIFLRHKTTRRNFYERHYAWAQSNGFDEIVFLNERDEITEGAISNIFVLREGRLITPPLDSGLLPGVWRRHILEIDPRAQEGILTVSDLESADDVFLCNSVRGMRRVGKMRTSSA